MNLTKTASFFAIACVAAASAATVLQADGQQQTPPATGQEQPAPPAGEAQEVQLNHYREVFFYPAPQRRDPFVPLVGPAEGGPRFEDLRLRGIVQSALPHQSVGLISDGEGKIYRVRQGDSIGRARVVEIGTRRVVFAVDSFGIVRQETLELERDQQEGGRR